MMLAPPLTRHRKPPMKKQTQHPQARHRKEKPSSDGAHQRRRKTKWAEVTCTVHGRPLIGSPWKSPQVKVPVPTSKRKSIGPCPLCELERKQAKSPAP